MRASAPTDLSLIVHQQRQIIADIAVIRDGMAALTVKMLANQQRLHVALDAVRAMPRQIGMLRTDLDQLGGTP